MAKLNKSLQDYFQIPILLKAVGDTNQDTLTRFEAKLNQHFSKVGLEEADCAELEERTKDFLKGHKSARNVRLKFMAKDFNNEWPELQVMYRCHIVIAIYEGRQNDPSKLRENITRLNKQMQDQRRKLVSLLVMNLEKEKSYELDIEKYFMFLPEVHDEDLAIFLEPAIQEIAKQSLLFFAEEIRKLRAEQNDYIVFNKNEQRTEQRYLKKKKRGRCLKLAGDFCLMIRADEDSLWHYKQAMSALKSIDDYHWMMSVQQGRAAANYMKCLEGPKSETESDHFQQDVKNLNQFMSNAIQLARKAKMPIFESQSYFKTIHSYRELQWKSGVDEWASLFVAEALQNYVLEEQVIYLSELALVFESLGMLRKRDYYMCCAARLSIEKKPQVSRMLLSYVKDHSPAVREWQQLYMLLLKQLAKCDANDQYMGVLECTLLSSCRKKLTLMEVGDLVQKLNYNLLDNMQLDIPLLQLKKVIIEDSTKKPKENRIGKPQKESGVTAPWRRLIDHKFQINEPIKFLALIENPLPVPLNIKYKLASQPLNQSNYSSVYLQASKTTTFPVQLLLDRLDHYRIQGMVIQLWHFHFQLPLLKEIRLEVYSQTSDYVIQCPEEISVQRSSEFYFQFRLKNLNKVASSKLKLNVSVYYVVETGLQENIFIFGDDKPPAIDSITVECKQSKLKGCTTHYSSPNHIVMELEHLRVHRSLLKKVEIGIDYIEQDGSKYQVSDLKVVPVSFRDSIVCEISKATELSYDSCRNYYEGKRVIADHFYCYLKVSKHPDDLKAYSMQVFHREHRLDQFILSERVEMVRQLKMKKQHIDKDGILGKVWEHLIRIRWECITNPQQKGEFFAQLNPSVKQQVLVASSKVVHMQFELDGKKLEGHEISVPRNSVLTVHYDICDEGQKDCSHQVVLHSRGVKQRNIGYAIQGKTKLRGSSHLTNQLDIEFENNYTTSFLVGIHFSEQLYLSERQLHSGS